MKEGLTWLWHKLKWLAPQRHGFHILELFMQLFEQVLLLDELGDTRVNARQVAELPRRLRNVDHLGANLVDVCLGDDGLSCEIRLMTDVAVSFSRPLIKLIDSQAHVI